MAYDVIRDDVIRRHVINVFWRHLRAVSDILIYSLHCFFIRSGMERFESLLERIRVWRNQERTDTASVDLEAWYPDVQQVGLHPNFRVTDRIFYL